MSKSKILEKIKKEDVKIKSKSYFVFRTVIYVLILVFGFLFSIFFASFIVFSLRAKGALYLPGFGFRGWGLFLSSFPWLLVIFALILIIVLEIFAKKFSVVYKKPLIYSILVIIILILLMSFLIGQTSMHSKLFKSAQEGKLPIMGPMYKENFIKTPYNVFIGKVFDISDNGFQLEIKNGEILSVIISEARFLPSQGIKKNDSVMIMGDKEDSIIKAFGVKQIKDNGASIYLKYRYMRMK